MKRGEKGTEKKRPQINADLRCKKRIQSYSWLQIGVNFRKSAATLSSWVFCFNALMPRPQASMPKQQVEA
jgi:hypothetical protein